MDGFGAGLIIRARGSGAMCPSLWKGDLCCGQGSHASARHASARAEGMDRSQRTSKKAIKSHSPGPDIPVQTSHKVSAAVKVAVLYVRTIEESSPNFWISSQRH